MPRKTTKEDIETLRNMMSLLAEKDPEKAKELIRTLNLPELDVIPKINLKLDELRSLQLAEMLRVSYQYIKALEERNRSIDEKSARMTADAIDSYIEEGEGRRGGVLPDLPTWFYILIGVLGVLSAFGVMTLFKLLLGGL